MKAASACVYPRETRSTELFELSCNISEVLLTLEGVWLDIVVFYWARWPCCLQLDLQFFPGVLGSHRDLLTCA